MKGRGKRSFNIYIIIALLAVLLFSLCYHYKQVTGMEGMEEKKTGGEENKTGGDKKSGGEEEKKKDFTMGFGAGKATTCPTYKKQDPDTGKCV